MAYTNTLITLAPDCPLENSQVPPQRGAKIPQHLRQYLLLTEQPYHYDHEHLIFSVYLQKENLEDLAEDEKKALWQTMFAKGHPCLRASALTKRYGFGAHYDANGKIAIYPVESTAYQKLLADDRVKKIPAMRSKRV